MRNIKEHGSKRKDKDGKKWQHGKEGRELK